VANQSELANVLLPDFKARKVKRKHWETELEYTKPNESISRANTDYILKSWKGIDPEGLRKLRTRLANFQQDTVTQGLVCNTQVAYKLSIYHAPIYFYGRFVPVRL
jgi:hypothetical protein